MHLIDLGLWAPFINQEEMFSWYLLPDSLAAEFRAYRPDGTELTPFTQEAYEQFHRDAVSYVRQSVAPYQPAYHNDDMHFAAAEADGLQAADAYAEHGPSRMPRFVRQMLGVSLRTHDAFHCASTFRVQARRGAHWPELGTAVSSEWVTSLANDQFLQRYGVNVPARLFQMNIAWSSTYGSNTPFGQQIHLPTPQPTTVWGALMRAADVCPPRDWKVWLQRTIGVNYGEIPAVPPAQTWAEWITREYAFAGYIGYCFDRLDHTAGFELSARVGWRRRLDLQRAWIGLLDRSRSQLRGYATELLQGYGVTLG